MDPRDLPEHLRSAIADYFVKKGDDSRGELLDAIGEINPALVDVRTGNKARLDEVLQERLEDLVRFLRSGLADDASPYTSPAVDSYAHALARQSISSDSIGLTFHTIQRVFVGELMTALAAHCSPAEFERYAPIVVDSTLRNGISHYRAISQSYADALRWNIRVSAAESSAQLDSVLKNNSLSDDDAAKLLCFPLGGRNLGIVIDGWFDDHLDLRTIHNMARTLPGATQILSLPLDSMLVAVWGSVTAETTAQDWRAHIGDRANASVGIGEIGTGLAGFRRTHEQALDALRVAKLNPDLHQTAVFSEVAPLTFLARNPEDARALVHAALGDLAGPSESMRALRTTLLRMLETGEDTAAVAKELVLHRNTVTYRMKKATALLPVDLGEKRLEVLLALRYLGWATGN